MNVLVISEPGSSGVFTYVESLCHFLVDEGAGVHLAYSDRRGSDRLNDLVRFVNLNGGSTVNMEVDSGVGLGDLRAFCRLWRLARSVKPDVVHCHSSKAGALGRMLAAVGVRAAFFYHPHAYYGMRPNRRTFDFFYDGIEAVLGRIGTTVAVSSDERRFALGRLHIPPDRISNIPNGVDTQRFRPASSPERAALRRAFNLPPGAVVLGAISRLSLQKDPATLYRAFALACESRPDLHLLHVGSGELGGEIEKLAADLGLTGRVTRLAYMKDSTAFYQAIDGFILTSTYEGLSLAALEALSADLPLVLSRAPGNIDLLELPLSHAWGAVPGDVGGFAKSIGLWHSAHLKPTTRNHRKVALEMFDGRSTQAAMLASYRANAVDNGAAGTWGIRILAMFWLVGIRLESTDGLSKAHTQRVLYPAFHLLTGVSYGDFFEWNVVIRKVGHIFLYGSLSLILYCWARTESRRARTGAWSLLCATIAFIGTIAVAALDEWHQTTIPSRTGTAADVMLDAAAGILSQIIIYAVSVPFRPRVPRESDADLSPGDGRVDPREIHSVAARKGAGMASGPKSRHGERAAISRKGRAPNYAENM